MDKTNNSTGENVRLTADVVAITPDRQVLLIERGPGEPHEYEGHWALPGGHVDPGEKIPDTAMREMREETDIVLTTGDLRELGTWGAPGRDPRGRYVTVAYLVTVPTGTTVTAGTDAARAAWWPLNALPEHIAFDHADIIAAAASRL